MLKITNLHFDYPEKSLLHALNFTVMPGTLLHLRGANGSGKTTLLKLLSGLLQPNEGDIFYQGQSIYHDRLNYHQNLCYVGHKNGISLTLTVRENCYFDLHYRKNDLSIDRLLMAFGLEGLGNVRCHLLSMGQRRRVGLLRLLMSKAPVWLLDEPFVALDTPSIETLMTHINKHLAAQGCVILTSHQDLPLKPDQYQEYGL
jgi:heme exporter protein A